MIRTYTDLIKLKTFEERFNYLVLDGVVGHSTFGADRYLNQQLYRSQEWRRARNKAIERDNACDLGIKGREIYDQIYVHHMNPVTIEDIRDYYDLLLDPEYLICTAFNTHQAVTFGDRNFLFRLPTERRKGDTKLW